MAEFTHLHLHTDYSLLDGACDVEKLVNHVDTHRPEGGCDHRSRQYLWRGALL